MSRRSKAAGKHRQRPRPLETAQEAIDQALEELAEYRDADLLEALLHEDYDDPWEDW